MESKIFLIFWTIWMLAASLSDMCGVRRQRRKCVRNSMLLRRGTFVLPIINISNWTAWNMNDEVLEKCSYS